MAGGGVSFALYYLLSHLTLSVSNGANPILRAKHQAFSLSHVIFIPDTQTLHTRAWRKVAGGSRFRPRKTDRAEKSRFYNSSGISGRCGYGPFSKPAPLGLAHRARRRTHMFIHSTGSKRG
jgi:hypothetical protein